MARRSADGQPVRPVWELSEQALERFLHALDRDRGAAAERYEQIRAKLLRFFEWRGCEFPDELTDETITRVIRKIDEGNQIQDPGTYCHGVARLVLLESFKTRAREKETVAHFQALAPIADTEDIERRLECLRACIQTLAASEQSLIQDYYRYEAGGRIDFRKRLAASLGIAPNALRIRVHRVTERLGDCVLRRLRQRGWL